MVETQAGLLSRPAEQFRLLSGWNGCPGRGCHGFGTPNPCVAAAASLSSAHKLLVVLHTGSEYRTRGTLGLWLGA